MQFGFGAPVSGALSAPETLARIATEGEAMGYDYTTISDHVVQFPAISRRAIPIAIPENFPAARVATVTNS